MVTLVSCFFDRNATSSLDNHAEFCRRTHAKHRFEPLSNCVDSIELRVLYKYQLLSDVLHEADEGEVLLFATENALFVRFHDFAQIMEGRDTLVTKGHFGVNTEIFVIRNNEENRRIVRGMAARCRQFYEYGKYVTEEDLLDHLPTVPDWDDLNGVVPIASMWSGQHPDLRGREVIAVSLIYTPRLFSKYGPQWRAVFARHVNACHASGSLQVFGAEAPFTADSNAPLTVYQPERPIAVVMLYTPNIASYARFGEASMRAYCEQHGYTLYMHRDVPPEFGRDACGNWAKPFLLAKYLPQHEWVFWIDADILAMNRSVKLETFTAGRERVLTADIAGWRLNSGVMGFRRSEDNARVLDAVLAKVREIEDVQYTFSSNGDQFIFMEQLIAHGLCPEMDSPELVSFRKLNTPWYYADQNTFLCHFHGLSTEMRTLYMSMESVPEGGFEAIERGASRAPVDAPRSAAFGVVPRTQLLIRNPA